MYRREIELKSHPELAVELERRGMLGPIDTSAQSPPVGDSLAVDSGATDLESASEVGPGKSMVDCSLSRFSGLLILLFS